MAAENHTNENARKRPIFMATHPRACSTAFERVMMTRNDILQCVHEPFGDAFYYGPERLGTRYDGDTNENERRESGFDGVTYRDVVERIEREEKESGKRIFIKDITHYLLPPTSYKGKTGLAPSLRDDVYNNGDASGPTPPNPTVIPLHLLRHFQFTFLIRHPAYAIPSYYRCTQPPLADLTGFHYFLPEEAGYRELREFFDYVIVTGLVPKDSVFVLDADDLLDHPHEAMRRYCEHVGVDFRENMLTWKEGGDGCEGAFEKWKGFHEDAIKSGGLRPRAHKKAKSEEEMKKEWAAKWGDKAADQIWNCVEENRADYEHLKGFKQQF